MQREMGEKGGQNACTILYPAGRGWGAPPTAEDLPQAPLQVTGDLSDVEEIPPQPLAGNETRAAGERGGVRAQKGEMHKLLE